MKQVTADVTARADREAEEAVQRAQEEARSRGEELSGEAAFLIHKAAWAGVTGADAVQVIDLPKRSCFGRTGEQPD